MTNRPVRSIVDLETESRQAVRNARALYPKLPGANLLEHAIGLLDGEFLAELSRALLAGYLLRLNRSESAREWRERREAEWLSPEIREAALKLPLRIRIGDKLVSRSEMSYPETGRYLRALESEATAAANSNTKILALKAIRKQWPRAKRTRRMTLGEVDLFQAKKAGLIE